MDQIIPKNLGEFDRRYRIAVGIVIVQIFVVAVLMIAALTISPRVLVNLEDREISIAWSVVLFIAIASFLARRALFSWERLKNIGLLKGVSGLLSALLTNAVILSVLGFIVAGLGFGIALATGSGFDMVRAGLVSFVLLIVNFPRKSVWRSAVAYLENA